MYMANARFGAARKSYQNVDLSSRIEGADPHGLVQILFEELMKAVENMAAAARVRDFGQRGTSQARALSILHGLEASLDYEQGGDIAQSLSSIYREARRLVLDAGSSNDTAPLLRAREMLGEIAGAWAALR